MRPFPIYPLYTQTVILSLDKPIADCFLFRPRKRLEKRRKRSHINASNASVIRASTPPAQTAHVCFHTRKRVHTRLCQQDRTQRLTRRNRGCFGWGRYYYPRSVPHVHKHPRAGYQKGVLCRFWALAEGTPEGVAAPLGCVIFSVSVEIAACMPCAQGLSVCARRVVVSLPSARFTCC